MEMATMGLIFTVGAGTRLLDGFGFAVPLNWAVVSWCLGGFAGLLIRNRKLREIGAS